jgi:hypothetical protein
MCQCHQRSLQITSSEDDNLQYPKFLVFFPKHIVVCANNDPVYINT